MTRVRGGFHSMNYRIQHVQPNNYGLDMRWNPSYTQTRRLDRGWDKGYPVVVPALEVVRTTLKLPAISFAMIC